MEVKKECKVKVCDFCGADKDVWASCTECGKDICYVCKPKHAKEYAHACWVRGSGDGLYCFDCIGKLMKEKDPLYHAYLAIEMLVKEYSSYYEDFKKRSDLADKLLADLIAKRKAVNEAKKEKQA